MNPDRVFIRKVEDLQRRTDSECLASAADVGYEVLMSAPLLRELLMGSPPLLHIANREHKVAIRFQVGRKPALEKLILEDKPDFYARTDGVYPGSGLPGSTIVTLNLDGFLREMVMLVHGDTVTVRDLIDYSANAAGAVHFGKLEKGKRAALATVDERLGIGGLEAALKCLIAIGQVVVDGVEPLVKRINADH
jgi:hypothetical protein